MCELLLCCEVKDNVLAGKAAPCQHVSISQATRHKLFTDPEAAGNLQWFSSTLWNKPDVMATNALRHT